MVKAYEDAVSENDLVVSVRTLILNLHSYDALLCYLRIHLRVLVRSRAMGCREIRNSLSGSYRLTEFREFLDESTVLKYDRLSLL